MGHILNDYDIKNIEGFARKAKQNYINNKGTIVISSKSIKEYIKDEVRDKCGCDMICTHDSLNDPIKNFNAGLLDSPNSDNATALYMYLIRIREKEKNTYHYEIIDEDKFFYFKMRNI